MSTPPPEVATVAATLRVASRWMREDRDRRMLLEAAENAELYWERGTCPVCEDVTCDEGCPLKHVRAALDGPTTPEQPGGRRT